MENFVTETLLNLKDEKNADFLSKLVPSIPRESILGVKVPVLRKLAKSLYGTAEGNAFLSSAPHVYLEENSLHFFIISNEKDFLKAIILTEEFLPYVDNWSTCDGFSSVAFKKNLGLLSPYIDKWIASEKTYTVRFGISMLLKYYLDGEFSPCVLEKVSNIKSGEYYVDMMIAWFFATALCKHWQETIKYLEDKKLSKFCHNKTIRKACESFRIMTEQKAYLKTLKV